MPKKRGESNEKTSDIENVKTSKKQRRIESKKNKIKAFLEVAKANDRDRGLKNLLHSQIDEDETSSSVVRSRKRRNRDEATICDENGGEGENLQSTNTLTPEEELNRLRAECFARKKRKMQQPLIFLSDIGIEAKFHQDPLSTTRPLAPTDIQQLFLMSLYGGLIEFQPKWCRFVRWSKCSHRVIIFVEGASANDYRKHVGQMRNVQTIFDLMVEVSGSVKYFDGIIQELFWIAMTSKGKNAKVQECIGTNKILDSGSPEDECLDLRLKNGSKKRQISEESNGRDKFSRVELLLSPKQMLREKYPFVPLLQGEGWMDFEYTKDEYLPVTPNSPLFAIDCEMCITTEGMSELTRVSIIDEKLNTIYDTFVKPDNEITNYLTQFSGVTRASLQDVTVRLADVQEKIRNILPPDAILCGQSLNCDLNALKMVHPYVVDTSVIYNLSGIRRHKSGLKLLSKLFLKEEIQSSKKGHDSIEDAKSVMKLVLLKLSKGIDFGDVILYEGNESVSAKTIVSKKAEEKIKKITLITLAEKAKSSQFQAKKSRNEEFYVDVVDALDKKDIFIQTQQRAIGSDVTIARLKACEDGENAESFYSELDSHLFHIYNSCASNALLVVVFGDVLVGENLAASENGLCMIRLKLDVT